jgi:hypothetical protein
MVNERPVVSTSGALFMSRFVSYIHVNQKDKIMTVTVTELTDERYEQIDSVVNQTIVNKFIQSTEYVQNDLLDKNIEASEIYQYLLTIMLNQC